MLDDRPARRDGDFVLYWMIASRRLEWSFALDRALGLARELDRPLVVLEAIRAGYPWACDRHHAFALQGMAEHTVRCRDAGVLHHAYVEPERGAGSGLLEALASRACAVVPDDYPALFLPRMVRAAASRAGTRFEAIDSNGLLPLSTSSGPFSSAYHFRRLLQKTLPDHLGAAPAATPLADTGLPAADALPAEVEGRWPSAPSRLLGATADALATLPIDHGVAPVSARGGRLAARAALDTFLAGRLHRYDDERNQPEAPAVSGLSPYLHYMAGARVRLLSPRAGVRHLRVVLRPAAAPRRRRRRLVRVASPARILPLPDTTTPPERRR